MITRREGASGPLAPIPGDATGEAMTDDDTSALALQSLRAAYDLLLRERDRLRRERDDLERENAALRRRLREGGR